MEANSIEFYQFHRTGNTNRRRRGVFYVSVDPMSRVAVIGHSLCRIKRDKFNPHEGIRIAVERTVKIINKMDAEAGPKPDALSFNPIVGFLDGNGDPDYSSVWTVVHSKNIPDSMLLGLEEVKSRIYRIIMNMSKREVEQSAAEHASDSTLTIKETEGEELPMNGGE